jgi:pilus assembly protein Flp/PilA
VLLKVPEAPSIECLSGDRICIALEENHMLNVFVSIQNRLAMLRDERGQTMAEYGVVLAVIAVIVVTALTALSGGITGALDNVRGVLGG